MLFGLYQRKSTLNLQQSCGAWHFLHVCSVVYGPRLGWLHFTWHQELTGRINWNSYQITVSSLTSNTLETQRRLKVCMERSLPKVGAKDGNIAYYFKHDITIPFLVDFTTVGVLRGINEKKKKILLHNKVDSLVKSPDWLRPLYLSSCQRQLPWQTILEIFHHDFLVIILLGESDPGSEVILGDDLVGLGSLLPSAMQK